MPGTPDLIAAFKDLEEARPAYCEADDMYSGDIDEVFASAKVRRLLKKARADEVEEFNYAHIPVDTIANRLGITSVTIASDDDGKGADDGVPAAESKGAAAKDAAKDKGHGEAPDAADAKTGSGAAQAALDRLWKENQLDAESDGLHLKVSKQGDSYLIVWPRSDDTGEKITAVDIRVNTAETVRAIYDAEDPLKMAYVIKSWTYDAPIDPRDEDSKTVQWTRANLYYDGKVERYRSLPNKKGKALCNIKAWEPFDDDEKPSVIKHPYGMPVFHFRNDRPYGRPEHLYAYGPQQMLNKLVMAQAVAVDYQSFPQRYLLMDPTQDQPMQNLLDPNHPEDDDDPEGDGNSSQLSAEASAVWRVWGAKSAGQFDASSPDTFLKPFDRYVQAMAELTETPLYRFGSAFAQTPSGAALRSADAPVVAKVENRQDAYDAVWEDALEFALSLLGFHDTKVSVSWKPAEQATDFEAWSVVDSKIRAGVPQKQALIETGYTEDQVTEWLGGEAAKNATLLRNVELLTSVAEALQAIGAAVAMGVVNEAQASGLVEKMLAGSSDDGVSDVGDTGT